MQKLLDWRNAAASSDRSTFILGGVVINEIIFGGLEEKENLDPIPEEMKVIEVDIVLSSDDITTGSCGGAVAGSSSEISSGNFVSGGGQEFSDYEDNINSDGDENNNRGEADNEDFDHEDRDGNQQDPNS